MNVQKSDRISRKHIKHISSNRFDRDNKIQFFSSNQRALKLSSNFLRKHAPFSFSSIESYWKNLSNRVLRTGKIHQLYRFNLSLSLKKKRRLSSLFRTLVLRRDTDQFLFCLERTNSPSFRGKEKNLIDAHYRATHNNNTRDTLETSSHQTFPLPPKKQGGWTQVTLSESEYS